MAEAKPVLINALRATARRLEKGAPYQWGHMGSCNCGHLVQALTKLSKAAIHTYAMRGHGDWNDQMMAYCPTSGLPMDLLITELLQYGLSTTDLKNLEKLSDKAILKRLPEKNLKHNLRQDVVLYLRAWATMLEEELAGKIDLNALSEIPQNYNL